MVSEMVVLKSKGIHVLLAISFLFSAIEAQDVNEACVTPDSLSGECINIRSCPYLLDMLKNLPSQPTVDNLRRYLCRFQGSQPFVCCPKSADQTDATINIDAHKNFKLLPANNCGISSGSDRIFRGSKTNIYTYPWMALIGYRDETGVKYRCSGTIINERYILTAAHCITQLPDKFKLSAVRVGEHDLSKDIDCDDEYDVEECAPSPQDIEIEEKIPHPRFDSKAIKDDIGLIRLSNPIDLSSDSAHPICLPLEQKPQNYTGKRLTIGGWGITMKGESSSELLTANVAVLDMRECAERYKRFVSINASTQLCSSSEYNSNSRLCVGDSGGPLMALTGYGRFDLRGVLSFAAEVCESPTYPKVYTLVEQYLEWILDSIKP